MVMQHSTARQRQRYGEIPGTHAGIEMLKKTSKSAWDHPRCIAETSNNEEQNVKIYKESQSDQGGILHANEWRFISGR